MITLINYNWRFSPENGEEFGTFQLGVKYGSQTVTHIYQNQNPGKENQWEVTFDDGERHFLYNVNYAVFKHEQDNSII